MTFLTNEQALRIANRMKKIHAPITAGSFEKLICDAVARCDIIAVDAKPMNEEDHDDQEDEP